jgi:hypothetical protein
MMCDLDPRGSAPEGKTHMGNFSDFTEGFRHTVKGMRTVDPASIIDTINTQCVGLKRCRLKPLRSVLGAVPG